MFLIQIPLLKRKAMALFPFVLINKRTYASDPVLIDHERIHLRQQVELLILPFYIFYLLSFLYHGIRTPNIEIAYRSMVFEKFDDDYLLVIHSPNQSNLACNLVDDGFFLNGKKSQAGLCRAVSTRNAITSIN